MFEPMRDVLAYWGVPDVDTPLPLATCAECGGVVCHCVSVEEALPDLDETASRFAHHVRREAGNHPWPSS